METHFTTSVNFTVSSKEEIEHSLQKNRVAILPPIDVIKSLGLVKQIGIVPKVIILDPWYNKGWLNMGIREVRRR